MRHPYDELLRQMEQDIRNSSDWFYRIVRATAPDKFWEPPADVYETRDAVKIKIEIAGVRREDIQIELARDARSITIRGLRLDGDTEACERTVYHQMEIYTGPFERVVQLPANLAIAADEVHAGYEDGFLLVTLPKRQAARSKTTQITVQG